MDPISMEKIRAMNKYNKSRRHLQLPTLSVYMAATFVLCLLLTSPAWFPRLCSFLSFFFLTITTLPDLVTSFLLSPKCLFVVGNLIVAFLVGESRLAPRRDDDQPSLVNEIHEDHVKKNTAMAAKTTTAASAAVAVTAADHSAFVGAAVVEEVEVEAKEEEGEEEELHKRVEDFIARVKKQRKLELKSFFDVDR